MLIYVFVLGLFSCATKNAEKSASVASVQKKSLSSEEKELRAIVSKTLAGIRHVSIGHYESDDVYIGVEPYPPLSSGTKGQPWDYDASGGFKTLGFCADSKGPSGCPRQRGKQVPEDPETAELVLGTYWVTLVKPNAKGAYLDFNAYGVVDLDGDGVYATYVATQSTTPTAITEDSVY